MIDTSLLNSASKGHCINGAKKSLWYPRGRPVLRKKTCSCTRTHRCPKHSNGAAP